MILVGAVQGFADAKPQFAGGQQAGGLDDFALRLNPAGLDRIQSGALDCTRKGLRTRPHTNASRVTHR